MRHLLPVLAVVLTACPTSFPMAPEVICEETALVVGLLKADCAGLNEQQTAAFRDRFAKQVECTPPPGDTLTIEPFECVDAIADMTCEQVEAKGDDWDEWLEVSFVCHTYLATGQATLTPSDTGL